MLPLHQSSISTVFSALMPLRRKLVGAKRLELLHLAALEPKSSASTNFATPPDGCVYYRDQYDLTSPFCEKAFCLLKYKTNIA